MEIRCEKYGVGITVTTKKCESLWQKPEMEKDVPFNIFSPITVLINALPEEIKSLLKCKGYPKILDPKQSWIQSMILSKLKITRLANKHKPLLTVWDMPS